MRAAGLVHGCSFLQCSDLLHPAFPLLLFFLNSLAVTLSGGSLIVASLALFPELVPRAVFSSPPTAPGDAVGRCLLPRDVCVRLPCAVPLNGMGFSFCVERICLT